MHGFFSTPEFPWVIVTTKVRSNSTEHHTPGRIVGGPLFAIHSGLPRNTANEKCMCVSMYIYVYIYTIEILGFGWLCQTCTAVDRSFTCWPDQYCQFHFGYCARLDTGDTLSTEGSPRIREGSRRSVQGGPPGPASRSIPTPRRVSVSLVELHTHVLLTLWSLGPLESSSPSPSMVTPGGLGGPLSIRRPNGGFHMLSLIPRDSMMIPASVPFSRRYVSPGRCQRRKLGLLEVDLRVYGTRSND